MERPSRYTFTKIQIVQVTFGVQALYHDALIQSFVLRLGIFFTVVY